MQGRKFDELPGQLCDVFFLPGNLNTLASGTHYTTQKIEAVTGELMWSVGRNNLSPMNVIFSLYVGKKENPDVCLQPFSFSRPLSFFNPINYISVGVSWSKNVRNGVRIAPYKNNNYETVICHAPNFSKWNIGQHIDMQAFREKYDDWLNEENRSQYAIVYAVSRGTSTGFCELAEKKEKYSHIKLAIFEGAFDTVEEIIPHRVSNTFKSPFVAKQMTTLVKSSLTFFKNRDLIQYDANGPSPIKSVENFPEDIPVAFITSEKDEIIPAKNTIRLANALNARGKNDVYLLKLKHSSHSGYGFDHPDDRQKYESFIHALYRQHKIKHVPQLADAGEHLLAESLLDKPRLGMRLA